MAALLLYCIVSAVLIWIIYRLSKINHEWFEKTDIPYEKPLPFLGNVWPILSQKEIWYDFLKRHYAIAKEKGISGLWQMHRPILIIGDSELVKKITIKDFDHFTDHRPFSHDTDITSRTLFSERGQRWRSSRAALSPVFTASKLRNMFYLIDKCGDNLDKYLKQRFDLAENSKDAVFELEARNLFDRFTSDAIASLAFGFENDSLNDPNNEFHLMAKDLTNFTSGFRGIKFFISQYSLSLLKLIAPEGILSNKSQKLLLSITKENINKRREQKIFRNDMLNFMMETTKPKEKEDGSSARFTDEEIHAQLLIFFFAGFDTISNVLSFITFLLAKFPEIQKKVHEEIDEILIKYQGKMTYDIIMNEMPYMESVFWESLRFYPQGHMLDRVCVKPYTIEETDNRPSFTLNPGDQVWIPVIGFHFDSNIFPEPEKFIPERFNEHNKNNFDSSFYMPFGAGPRQCIANRFAKMEVKIGLFYFLKHFEVCFTKKTDNPPKLVNKGPVPITEKGIWLGIKPRKSLIDEVIED